MTWWRRTLVVAAALIVIGGGGAALLSSTTTLQGVNFRQRVRPIPVYVKGIDFVQRHYYYRQLASEIVNESMSPAERALAAFEWTRRNIRDVPPGLPVIDDHISHIMIRGYGTNDQMADAFATLCTYAGVPAFWARIRTSSGDKTILTFARIEDRWIPFDMWAHLAFRNRRGALASVDELLADPALIDVATAAAPRAEADYRALISRETMVPFRAPRWLRADMQRPWPRLVYETRRAIGLEQDEEQEP